MVASCCYQDWMWGAVANAFTTGMLFNLNLDTFVERRRRKHWADQIKTVNLTMAIKKPEGVQIVSDELYGKYGKTFLHPNGMHYSVQDLTDEMELAEGALPSPYHQESIELMDQAIQMHKAAAKRMAEELTRAR